MFQKFNEFISCNESKKQNEYKDFKSIFQKIKKNITFKKKHSSEEFFYDGVQEVYHWFKNITEYQKYLKPVYVGFVYNSYLEGKVEFDDIIHEVRYLCSLLDKRSEMIDYEKITKEKSRIYKKGEGYLFKCAEEFKDFINSYKNK